MALRTAALRWGLASLAGWAMVTSFEPCPMCLRGHPRGRRQDPGHRGRRTVGEAPLGDYDVEALLAMTGRTGDIAVQTRPLLEIAEFYS